MVESGFRLGAVHFNSPTFSTLSANAATEFAASAWERVAHAWGTDPAHVLESWKVGHVRGVVCFFCPNRKMEQIKFSLESLCSGADWPLLSQDPTPARRSPCAGSWVQASESIRPGVNV